MRSKSAQMLIPVTMGFPGNLEHLLKGEDAAGMLREQMLPGKRPQLSLLKT